jgi:hypothetical protein
MLKVNVGLNRKVGQSNYGSRGASVHLELELESALVADSDRLQARIRQLFQIAKQSVDEQLDQHEDAAPPNGNGVQASNGSRARPATYSQVRALRAIAHRQGVNLPALVQQQYGVGDPQELSIDQASGLIDSLKSTPAGAQAG